jgi:glutathione S-transferase
MNATTSISKPFLHLRAALRNVNVMLSATIAQRAMSQLSPQMLREGRLDCSDEDGARMHLYYAPGACSLASHISLRETGLPFDMTMVDIRTRKTDQGEDYMNINPKGYVPALTLGAGRPFTENVAILSLIADEAPHLLPEGAMGRLRLIEMLAFIASEIHKPFIGVMFTDNDAMRAHLKDMIGARLAQLDAMADGAFLFGQRLTTADAYFYVMARWAGMLGVSMPAALSHMADRIQRRPAVEAAIKAEGLVP